MRSNVRLAHTGDAIGKAAARITYEIGHAVRIEKEAYCSEIHRCVRQLVDRREVLVDRLERGQNGEQGARRCRLND
jgi:hypothetical protein